MNTSTRTKNSGINIIVGFICQIIIMLISFLSRTVFIKCLGNEYLGVNGLYSNILSILSLAELGIGNVLLFSLYKPIAQNDEKKVLSLIYFYKKIYRILAIAILVLGIAMIPFLSFFINNGNIDSTSLVIYYILFLFDSVSSYIFIYKSTLITADQKNYIVKKYTTLCVIICKSLQMAILILFKNYILFLICQVSFTIITNFILSCKADRLYPFLKNKNNILLDTEEKKFIYSSLKSTFIYKLSNKLLNSTDNIIIASLLGTIVVGYYSNYCLIITALNSAILILSNSFMSSIGNLNAKESSERKYDVFCALIFLFHWIIAFCTISFLIISKDFVSIWIGNEYVLNNNVVFVIALNFYLAGIEIPVWLYREALGLFSKVKYIILTSAILNILLSIILGKFFGLFGILISTFISKFITTSWYEPLLLYKNSFNKKVKNYYFNQIRLFLITIISFIITFIICNSLINFDSIVLNIIIKSIVCTIVINLIFFLLNFKSNEFKFILNKFLKKNKKI